MSSNSEYALLNFIALRKQTQETAPELASNLILIHGAEQLELFPAALKVAFASGFANPLIIPEHVKDCCGDDNKLLLITDALKAADMHSPACLILPAAETALFRLRDDEGRAMSVMVSEMIHFLDQEQKKHGHLIIMTSHEPWIIDQRLLRSGRIDSYIRLNSSREKDDEYKMKLVEHNCHFPQTESINSPETNLDQYDDSSRWRLSWILQNPGLTKSSLEADFENSSKSEKWLICFYLTFLFPATQAEKNENSKKLIEKFADFNFWMDIHSQEGRFHTSLIIYWIKTKLFFDAEKFWSLLLEHDTKWAWLGNYWDWKYFPFSEKFIDTLLENPYAFYCRHIVWTFASNLYYAKPKKKSDWKAWQTKLARLVFVYQDNDDRKKMALFILYGEKYSQGSDWPKYFKNKENISYEDQVTNIEHAIKIFPTFSGVEKTKEAIEELQETLTKIKKLKKSENGIIQRLLKKVR